MQRKNDYKLHKKHRNTVGVYCVQMLLHYYRNINVVVLVVPNMFKIRTVLSILIIMEC